MFFSPHGGGKTNKTTLVIFFMGAKIRSMGGNRGCKNFIFPPWWGENRHFFCIHGGGKTNTMGGKFVLILGVSFLTNTHGGKTNTMLVRSNMVVASCKMVPKCGAQKWILGRISTKYAGFPLKLQW